MDTETVDVNLEVALEFQKISKKEKKDFNGRCIKTSWVILFFKN